jgi:hypothetical protein
MSKATLVPTNAAFAPRDVGVELSRAEFGKILMKFFCDKFGGISMVEELLVYPDSAKQFCCEFRESIQSKSVPDDYILRLLLQCKKGFV